MRMERRPRAIDKIYKRRDRIEMPEYQRNPVWTAEKKRKLIDTIFNGWHLPKFYFRKLDDNTFECVDGQQRLTAIWEFCEGKLTLDQETAKLVGGYTYKELPLDVTDRFDDFEIDIEEIEDATEEELRELFRRLQLGVPLNTAEKLNATSGDMTAFCKKTIKQPFFKDKIAVKNTRDSHFEIVVRWMLIESRGIPRRTRFQELESFLNDNRSFSEKSATTKRVLATLKYLHQAFPNRAGFIKSKASTLSICMLAARVVERGLQSQTAQIFGEFVEDFFTRLTKEIEKGSRSKQKDLLSYQEAITYASAEGDSIKKRINILTQQLATYNATFSSLLASTPAAADKVTQSIAEQAEMIRQTIYNINESYAADHGDYLFTLTNKSIKALNELSRPCRNENDYKKLIDNLYFLIYEGSGSCNRLPQPPPQFSMDVKVLRTGLRHDVDHGKPADMVKKKKQHATTFQKYSGKKTLGECGPEEFLATQLRLYAEMRDFLEALLN